MNFKSNIAITVGTRGTVALINFLLIFLTFKVLGAEARGVISIFVTDVAALIMISNVLIGSTVTLHSAKHQVKPLLLYGFIWGAFVCGMGSLTIGIIHEDPLQTHLFGIAFLQALTTLFQCILVGRKEIGRFNITFMVVPFVSIITILGCFYLLNIQTIEVYIWALYAGYGLNTILSLIFILPQLKNDKTRPIADFMKLFIYGAGTEVAGFLHFINNRILYYFIFYMLGKGSLGFFSISIVLMESVWIISRSICVNQYSQIVNTDSRAEQRGFTLTSLKIVATLSIAAYALLAIVPTSLYESLLDQKLPEFKNQLYYLIPGGLCISLSNVWGTYFSGRKKYYVNIVKSGLGLVVIATVSWFILMDHNLSGAAIALSAGHLTSGVILLIWYYLEPKEPSHEATS